jgi:hypothetical protein
MCTTLSVLDSQAILTDIIDAQTKLDACDNCGKPFDGPCFFVCRFPEKASTTVHKGHTCCKRCVDDRAYIGEKGACNPCLRLQPTGTRANIHKAGIALIPAVENALASRYLTEVHTAQARIDECNERDEQARIQEGEDRRRVAVQEVQRKQAQERIEARLVQDARL